MDLRNTERRRDFTLKCFTSLRITGEPLKKGHLEISEGVTEDCSEKSLNNYKGIISLNNQ